MGNHQLIAELDLASMKEKVPAVRTGHTVQVTQKIKEGDKERLQTFEGLVIAVHNKGGALNSSITVRKMTEGIGVEKVFPLHSPSIVEIKITKIAKIRRAKLYYMRDRFGKSARLKEVQITQEKRDSLTRTFKEAAAPVSEEVPASE